MAARVDSAFIRRAVELADLNAVRVALYQQTRDPEVAAIPPTAKLDAEGRERLIAKAVAWLEEHARPGMPSEPEEGFLRQLMNMATGEKMPDLEFEARRDLAAFKAFPMTTDWTHGRPKLPEDFRVVVVGSGFSGIAMGVQLSRLGIPYVVLDRRPEPGGTWSINRYPDIRVDTISITYEFFFEKNHPWTEYFARGPEVRQYLENVSRAHGVHRNTRFERSLEKATWDEGRKRWRLEIASPNGTEHLEANVLVTAVGTFANPRFPKLAGQESFRGRILHPARWPDDFDARGKRVAILGNGSTGVQLLAPIAEQAEQVHVFQRTPQWISPREKYGKAIEPEIRWLLDHFPGYWNWWRYMAIAALFPTHGFLLVDEAWKAKGGKFNAMNDKLREDLTAYIHAQTGGRKDLVDRLVPDYAPFSRRPVVDNGWYRALTRANVELVTDPIARLTEKGIETADGRHREVDTIVTATGFEVMRYLEPARFEGQGGQDLHEFWSKDGPRAYLGMMVPRFPNFFMLYGPNSQPVSGGTGVPIWFVLWSAYVAQCIVRMIETGGSRVQVNAPWYGPDFHRMCSRVDWNDVELA